MAPERTSKSSTSQVSASKANLAEKRKPKHRPHKGTDSARSDILPGVQKIKASLRQTKRLLAKDNIAADVRVNTERRLKALEAQLHEAEIARKERVIAQRYHKIKFFERQKVTRKLKQVKRQLEACTDKKERKKLEKSLRDLRVDLNYILHYPKLTKYVSLFPPEVRRRDEDGEESAKAKDKEIAHEFMSTDAQREEIRKEIRERMERGELSVEPEVENHRPPPTKSRQINSAAAPKGAHNQDSSRQKHVPEVVDDDFFSNDSDGDGDDKEEDDDDRMDDS